MAKNEDNRIRIVKVYEYLRMHSDAEHPVKVSQIIRALQACGIKCDRRAIYKDLKCLKESYDLQETKGSKYYLKNSGLNLGHLRFLMDVAQSAYSLSETQTNKICEALESIAGSHKVELVRNQIIYFDRAKSDNEKVFDIVEMINHAIELDCKVSFRYFHRSFGGKPYYKHGKERYLQNPVALVFNDGRYYFIAYDDNENTIKSFRVDRMSEGKIEYKLPKANSDLEAQFITGDIKDRMSAFGMWTTGAETVTFLVENDYVEDIYEKFGYDISIIPQDKNHFRFTAKVNLSDVFFGWCAGYGTHIKILSPQSVKDTLVQKLRESLSLYPEEEEQWLKQNQAKK